ncbi:hypothetical protein KC717_01940 [Candidatus Dojkabacteria bacterium]|uniref:Uncharacterized protein n=1 Tax=Candidatus Dojkabacteria bacterium TaxID=2099670 RepID=A0A955L7D9_9BACT|nr:hypothetical protein [Candidatus Dojkabacteria bacterium]
MKKYFVIICMVLAILSILIGSLFLLRSDRDDVHLSQNSTKIYKGREELLSIDNGVIYNFFASEVIRCQDYFLSHSPMQLEICQNENSFQEYARFREIIVSPDQKLIGFEIQSDLLESDSVVGVLDLSLQNPDPVLLTNYYLGNEFLAFSPTGKYFIYQGECWEGNCGLYIYDSNTFEEVSAINHFEYQDMRQSNAEFVRWISDSEIEYLQDGEVTQQGIY